MGYGQFCAVARALDALGERWSMLIVREMLMGSTTYTDIRRGIPSIPRATLAARLRQLTASGIVEPVDGGYELTAAGRSLVPVMTELARWASHHDAGALGDEHLDAAALTWDMQRRVDTDRLPARPVVVEIELTDRRGADRRHWLHLSRRDVQLCRTDTGAPIDVWLSGPTAPITRWWLGEIEWSAMLRDGVSVTGSASLRRQLPTWFHRYAFAAVVA